MSRPPRILITNDDGVDAPGIAVMRRIAETVTDDIWIVAPSGNQSGAGHKFTLGQELSCQERGGNVYTLPGTPADCVVVGYTHILKDRQPDVVLSGVNHGQNLGDLIHCSGTMAGAREGVLQGALGIAMSQAIDFDREHEIDWHCAATYGAGILRTLMAQRRNRHVVYNVNFPMIGPDRTPDVRVVPHQRFSRSPFAYYPSRNAGKFFIAIPETPQPLDPDCDFHVLHHDQAITITPLSLEQTDTETMKQLEGRFSTRPETAS